MWIWLLCTPLAAALDPPEPAEPVDEAVVTTTTPTLTVADPTDPDATLILELYDGIDSEVVLTSRRGLRQGTDSTVDGLTSWTVDVSLAEDARYSWTATSQTNTEISEPSARATFRVNAENEPPSAPIQRSPGHGVTVETDPPLLIVSPGIDPDGDAFVTRFRVEDADGALLEAGEVSDTGLTATFSGEAGLGDQLRCWRVWTEDELGLTSSVSPSWCFWVDADNEAPSAPSFLSPTDGGLYLEAPEVTLSPCLDPEERQLTLSWELRDEAGEILESDHLSLGDAGPWTLSPTLPEGALSLSAWCDDGAATSTTATVSFTLDADASVPAAPTGLSPDAEAWLPGESLQWEPVEDAASYTVRVEDAGGAVIYAMEGTTSQELTPQSNLGWTVGDYSWQVHATSSSGVEGATGTASFTIEAPADTGEDTGYGRDGRPCGCQGLDVAGPWWLGLLLWGRRRSVQGDGRRR